jgi:hypothetical protein
VVRCRAGGFALKGGGDGQRRTASVGAHAASWGRVQNFYRLMKFILCFVVRFGRKRGKKGSPRVARDER